MTSSATLSACILSTHLHSLATYPPATTMQQACHSTTGISGWKSCNVSHVPINQHTCSIPRNCSVSPALASGPPQHATPAHHRQQVCVRVQAMKGFGFGSGQKADKQCPCGSGQEYSSCCQRYHKSTVIKAPTAEAVLRARFSAYAKKDWKFIVSRAAWGNRQLQKAPLQSNEDAAWSFHALPLDAW